MSLVNSSAHLTGNDSQNIMNNQTTNYSPKILKERKNSIYHISLPLRVVLTADGREIGSVVPETSSSNLHRAVAEFDIPSNISGKLVLIVYRDLDERTMALDEIEGF